MDLNAVFSVMISLLSIRIHISTSQLTVNVKNAGGEVMQEIIESNTTTDTIRLTFEKFDGTSVTQFIDFRNVSILYYLVPVIRRGIGFLLYIHLSLYTNTVGLMFISPFDIQGSESNFFSKGVETHI